MNRKSIPMLAAVAATALLLADVRRSRRAA